MLGAERKYLARYAESTAKLAPTIDGSFTHAIVIPAYGEGENLDRVVASIPRDHGSRLAIVVLNERDDSPVERVDANRGAAARLAATYSPTSGSDHLTVHEFAPGVLAVLRCAMPSRQGVGLARKLGCDLAFGVWADGRLSSSWIHCTDADVRLPPDYLEIAPPAGAALLYPFRHLADDVRDVDAMLRYEISLRLYVLGLVRAGSRYAFHSIGSTMAVDARAYARCRGFPRRQAAEDFYLLNKLAKLGAVHTLTGAPIQIAGRVSDRVPFGTGRAIGDARSGRATVSYDPRVFDELREILGALRDAIDGDTALRLDGRQHRTADRIGLANALAVGRRQAPDSKRLHHRMFEWLDAFRTMKLVHALRDDGLPSLSIEDALVAWGYPDDPTQLEQARAWAAGCESEVPCRKRETGGEPSRRHRT